LSYTGEYYGMWVLSHRNSYKRKKMLISCKRKKFRNNGLGFFWLSFKRSLSEEMLDFSPLISQILINLLPLTFLWQLLNLQELVSLVEWFVVEALSWRTLHSLVIDIRVWWFGHWPVLSFSYCLKNVTTKFFTAEYSSYFHMSF
jgi:hypothetical protein